MYADPVKKELEDINTFVLLAFIFGLIIIVLSGIIASVEIILSPYIVYKIIDAYILASDVIGVFVVLKINEIKIALSAGDILKVHNLMNMELIVIAIIFDGVIPGILLFISKEHIDRITHTTPYPPVYNQMQPQQPGQSIYNLPTTAQPVQQYPQATPQLQQYPSQYYQQQYQYPQNPAVQQQYSQPLQPQIQYIQPPPQQPVLQQTGVTVCQSCHRAVSSMVVVCPYCGYKIR